LRKNNQIISKKQKMQFLLVAFDGTDSEALNRRLKVTAEHLKRTSVLRQRREGVWEKIEIRPFRIAKIDNQV
jgi:hypothetical protein